MRKRKVLSLALSVVMVATMAAGCGSKSKDSDAETTLTLGIWPSAELSQNIPTFEGYVKTMKELHPDIKCEPKSYTYATDTFMSLAESGNCPTIFETWLTEPQKLIKQGLVADITDELKERGWTDKMKPEILKAMSDENGRVYGIPRDANVLGLMCNVEIFKKAGLVDSDGVPQFPKTWDELAQTAVKIKKKTGAAGLCLLAKDNGGGWHFSNIAWDFGATLCKDNGDGTYTCDLNSKEAIKAMEYVRDLKWKYDVLTDDPSSEDWASGFQKLGTGGCGMYIAATDAVDQATQVNGLPIEQLAEGPLPAGPTGIQYSLTGGTPYMFAKDATKDQINAALDFIEVMGKSPDVNDTLMKGLEANAANRASNGVPVIQGISCWNNQDYIDADKKVVEEYSNVDEKMYSQYFDTINKEGNMRVEEPGDPQEMYDQLTKVIQSVVTNKDADIEKLMTKADENYQKILDSKFKKK